MQQKVAFSLATIGRAKLLIFLIGVFSIFDVSATSNNDNPFFNQIQHKYGIGAPTRIKQWQKLLKTASHLSEREQLKLVNNFFNQRIDYVDDKYLWGVNDYWATPLELLFKGAGDCEDLSIAKFFTLLKLGIPQNKIRLTYVRALKLNQTHMVVTYSSAPLATPIILDNLIPGIKPESKRKDLLPIFSFNDSGVWLEKHRGSRELVGNSSQIVMWNDLRKRMVKIHQS